MSTTVTVVAGAVLAAATLIGIQIEIGTRARAWRRIAEERRWNWERRIEADYDHQGSGRDDVDERELHGHGVLGARRERHGVE